jgi:hypothetical protein
MFHQYSRMGVPGSGGDAQRGCVGAPPNCGEIHGGRGDVEVLSIGVPGSKIIKIYININDKIPTITIHPM